VEDRNATIKAGHYVSRDVDFAVITRPGSRDTFRKEAQVWLNELRDKARSGMIPQSWPDAFTQAYKAWQSGEEAPVEGTPIKGWPILSPSAQRDLIAAGIRTVEDLAQLPDADLKSIGTGAMGYKQKARAWLEAANSTGKVAEQLAQLSTKVGELTALVTQQAAEIDRLRQFEPTGAAKAKNPLTE
jgi:hypothetical protein